MTSRREFLGAALPGVLSIVRLPGRAAGARAPMIDGRLTARPRRPTRPATSGLTPLNLSAERDGMLFVPRQYRLDRPTPLVLTLHGAGGSGARAIEGWRAMAQERGMVVLAPDSRGPTWDGIGGSFGPDVGFIDRALMDVFSRCVVDPRRLTLAGFSDGATYALSLGLVNGDLFRRVVAFSPGFIVPAEWHGEPRFFVSHGRADRILPIDMTSRRILVQLQRGGYDVTYREFDGGHEVPAAIRSEATDWMLR